MSGSRCGLVLVFGVDGGNFGGSSSLGLPTGVVGDKAAGQAYWSGAGRRFQAVIRGRRPWEANGSGVLLRPLWRWRSIY